MNCKHCGTALADDTKFCTGCGKMVEKAPAFCSNCGTAVEADVRFCKNCGAPVEKSSDNEAHSYTQNSAQRQAPTGAEASQASATTASPYNRFAALVRKTVSGVPFLVLSILISCLTLFSTISLFRSFEDGFFAVFVQLLPLAFLIASTVGCWLAWVGAKNPSDTGFVQRLKLAKIYANYQCVMMWIATIAVGVLGLLALILSVVAVDAAGDLFDSVDELGFEEIGDIFMDIGGAMIAILFFVIAIVVTVMALMIVRYTKLLHIVNAVVSGHASGIVPRISPMSYIVLTFIVGVCSVFGAFVTFQIDALSGFVSLISAAVTVLPAVILLMIKSELDACHTQPLTNAAQQPRQFVQQ